MHILATLYAWLCPGQMDYSVLLQNGIVKFTGPPSLLSVKTAPELDSDYTEMGTRQVYSLNIPFKHRPSEVHIK